MKDYDSMKILGWSEFMKSENLDDRDYSGNKYKYENYLKTKEINNENCKRVRGKNMCKKSGCKFTDEEKCKYNIFLKEEAIEHEGRLGVCKFCENSIDLGVYGMYETTPTPYRCYCKKNHHSIELDARWTCFKLDPRIKEVVTDKLAIRIKSISNDNLQKDYNNDTTFIIVIVILLMLLAVTNFK